MKALSELNPTLEQGAYIIYVRSRGFLARQIQFFMRLYALRFKRVWRKPVNHTDIMVNGHVCGAQAPVSKARMFEEYYDEKPRKLFIYRINPGIDIASCIQMLGFSFAGLPYDYKNFIDFIYKLFTGRWRGHTGVHAIKRVYCIELSHMIMRAFKCEKLLDASDYDNDPEMSRQWAIDNLEFVGEYQI